MPGLRTIKALYQVDQAQGIVRQYVQFLVTAVGPVGDWIKIGSSYEHAKWVTADVAITADSGEFDCLVSRNQLLDKIGRKLA